MLEVYERLGTGGEHAVHTRIILTHEQRDRGRLRVFCPEGEEVRVFLTRGTPLIVGEYLRSQCGRIVQVEGAIEPVTVARCDDRHLFARACYHLGNRHVKVQIGDRVLRIQPDHVLEDMLLQLGLQIEHAQHVFVPESGAYAGRHEHGKTGSGSLHGEHHGHHHGHHDHH